MSSILRVLFVTSLLCSVIALAGERSREVMIVATMHGFHQDHEGFDFEDLFRLVETFEPDLVGVEIRPEDIGADGDYLRANYPHEMVELARRYGDAAFGFDWLGDDVAGRPIPDGYWEHGSPIKALERELATDAAFAETEEEQAIALAQKELLVNATAATLNDGRYDELTARSYELTAEKLRGTRYQPLSDFYARRDREIAERLIEVAQENPGRRIIVLMGADHRGFAEARLREAMGSQLKIVPVGDPPIDSD
jgi:hypothetical protein